MARCRAKKPCRAHRACYRPTSASATTSRTRRLAGIPATPAAGDEVGERGAGGPGMNAGFFRPAGDATVIRGLGVVDRGKCVKLGFVTGKVEYGRATRATRRGHVCYPVTNRSTPGS